MQRCGSPSCCARPRSTPRRIRSLRPSPSVDACYTSDVAAIRHRDLPVQYLYREATSTVRGVDVTVRPGLKVGYVMGVGDEVPAAIAQLGAEVQLLRESDLASGDLTRFDTIVTGTRAYAVRSDLRTHNTRLLEYVKGGGQPGRPLQHARVHTRNAGALPRLAAAGCRRGVRGAGLRGHPRARITRCSQRRTGSALPISTAGSNSAAPSSSRAGMRATRRCCPRTIADSRRSAAACCTPPYGKGHYTYMAYALHRQLPAGVPGAYRLLANLICGRTRGQGKCKMENAK